jgi:hypothetical protein
LIQTDTNAPVLHIRHARGVRVRDLNLSRAAGRTVARASAIRAEHCADLVLEGLTISHNQSAAASISLESCTNSEVVRCRIENYMALGVDDRTGSPHYGYAFRCIDGTGIAAAACRGLLVAANRVVEHELRPTPELKARHRLGDFVRRAATKGSLVSQQTWEEGYVNNWHQGSAIVVTAPEQSDYVRILDNHIENGAQGIDIHADHVTITGNTVVNCFLGMKAMHGSRHVLIANNQFSRNDLWAIGLMPGTAAHAATAAAAGQGPRPPNVDGGSVIANNIISDFGYGDSYWIWGAKGYTRAPIVFDRGQEPDDPPLAEVVVTGNIVFDTGRDGVWVDGVPKVEPPRYRHAVFISPDPTGPRGLRFSGNLFHPGTDGVANLQLQP